MKKIEVKRNGGKMSQEKFWCVHCGMKFRYKVNKKAHEKKCAMWYITPNKWEDVAPK